jgi:signal transduction histidine kinase
VDGNFAATWVSASSTLGLIFYAVLAGVLGVFSSPANYLAVFVVGLVGLLCLLGIAYFRAYDSTPAQMSLKGRLDLVTRVIVFSSLSVVLLLDLIASTVGAIDQQQKFESTTLAILESQVAEPLGQGSFIEAQRRISLLQASGAFLCASVEIWDFKSDGCRGGGGTIWPYRVRLDLRSFKDRLDAEATALVIFDRAPLVRGVLFRLFLLLGLVLVMGLVAAKILGRTSQTIVNDMRHLVTLARGSLLRSSITPIARFKTTEFEEIGKEIEGLVQERAEASKSKALGELAAQVAHDIRSPLTALNLVAGTLLDIGEEKRILIRQSAQRINDIANDLLLKSKARGSTAGHAARAAPRSGGGGMTSCEMVASLVDAVVSEKRMEFRDRVGLRIEQELSSGYGVFASVNRAAFARSISNLINNSVESGPSVKTITARVVGDPEDVRIEIEDDGGGMAPSTLDKVRAGSGSYDKSVSGAGFGLGLLQVKRMMESCGGALQIESEIGIGTTVTLKFPRQTAPREFVSELKVRCDQRVVVVDDDETIHQVWKSRFQAACGYRLGASKIKFFSSLESAQDWLATEGERRSDCVFLVDLEFVGATDNGMGFIQRNGIASRSFLVTSRCDDSEVREKATQMSLAIIPKGLLPFVPIKIT